MPKRSDKIRKLKRELKAELSGLRMTQARAIKLYEVLSRVDYLISEIDETAERMVLWGDEWSKDDHPHAIRARAPAVGALQPRNEARGGPTVADPNRPYCKPDQSCCDFTCGN
jgi:hypothetical protein